MRVPGVKMNNKKAHLWQRQMITVRKVIIPFLLAIVVSLFQASVAARNVQFERINTEHGLSQAAITAMVQDQNGYIWIGTQEGLNRYDGYEFKTFEHDAGDANSISNDWVWSLTVDHKGQLWIGTNNGGLSRYDESKGLFVNYLHSPHDANSLRSNQVRFVFEDSDHLIWIGTKGGGLSRLDPDTGIFTHYRHDPENDESLPSDSVNFIYEWGKTLLVGTDFGIAIIDGSRTQVQRYGAVGDYKIRVIHEYQSKLWIGTHANGLRIFDPLSSNITVHKHIADDPASLPGNLVRDILVDHQDSIWIATDRGLAEWSPGQQRFYSYTNDPLDQYSISDNRIDSLLLDDGNVLWVGTYGGISRWNYVSGVTTMAGSKIGEMGPGAYSEFQNYHAGSGHLSNDIITSIAESKTGEIWLGTYGGGVNRLIPSSDSSRLYDAAPVPEVNLADKRVMALAIDDLNNVWIGTRTSGLYQLNPESGDIVHFTHDPSDETSLSSNGIAAIYPADNIVWVGTYGGGLNRLNVSSGKFARYTHNPDEPGTIGSNRVLTIYRDSQGEFWIGTEDGGLNRFNALRGTFSRFVHDPGNPRSISNDTAWEVLETADGSLWVGTLAAGLNRWSAQDRADGNPVFTRYAKGDGLRGETIYGILEGPSGDIWLSGNRGLSELKPASGEIRHFDKTNGIRGDEFNFGARLRSRSGHLLFGGPTGIVIFLPSDIM